MSRGRLLATILALLCAPTAWAVDPPHWTSVSSIEDCNTSCHALHGSGNLTQSASNVNLCQSCHNDSGAASAMPLRNTDKALPGTQGTSHGFDALATNATYGATPPTNAPMSQRIMDGKVVCSTCHNQHRALSTNGSVSHISAASQLTALGSTGTVTSGGTFTGATGFWYLVQIQTQGSQSSATFRWSKDNKTTWAAQSVPAGNGSPVALDSGVTVTFAGAAGNAFKVGEEWQFYGSWPFLRVKLDEGDSTSADKYCRDCHAGFVHDTTSVETYDGNKKGHPVGLPLGYGGRTYDRATPLDGNGAVQGGGSADTNATNDLRLDATNRIQCWTCHGLHFADSNTQTKDGP